MGVWERGGAVRGSASPVRPCSRAPMLSFTLIELMVVIGVILVLMSLLFPVIRAYFENARIEEMRAQLGIVEAALAEYRREFGDCPPSSGAGNDENAGIETMLGCLRTSEQGGPFVKEHIVGRWLEDTDGDGRQELVDPWRNPWIYFHHADYPAGAVYYRLKARRTQVRPVKKGDAFENLTSYQLWACGPNKTDQSGQDDDIGNVGR